MAEITKNKDLQDSDVALSGGNAVITVTSSAPTLQLTESEQSSAVTYNSGYLDYVFNVDTEEYTLVGRGDMAGSAISITSTHLGYPVTGIADSAFAGDETLKTIIIPPSVRKIGKNAFDGCELLTNVVIEDVDEDDDEDLTIGEYAFRSCAIETINIPSRVVKIGESAFESNIDCTDLTFSDNSRLVEIGKKAFYECESIGSAFLPKGLEILGYGAFSGCTMLRDVELPSTLQVLENYAFANCVNLENVEYSGTAQLTTIGQLAFYKCERLPKITIPSTVTFIGRQAFSQCLALNSVAFEDVYTWFLSYTQNIQSGNEGIVDSSTIYPATGATTAAQLLKDENGAGGCFWHKLKQMIKPQISLEGSMLTMTDPLGVAEIFFIYVNGKKRAEVYPEDSGSGASLDETGEEPTSLEETEE